jgi:hypothetical protein
MRNFAKSIVCCWCFAGVCAAQSARATALPIAALPASSVAVRLRLNDAERLQWEAARTLYVPASRTPIDIESRPIRLQVNDAAALSLPKLRREWLQPSVEADLSPTDLHR